MDTDRFDALVRSLAIPSRRTLLGLALGGALGALLSGPDAEAKKKGKKGKKGKKKTKTPPGCPTACCAHADCGARNRCVDGVCVGGRGTCAAGLTSCFGTDIPCNDTPGCKCFVSATGATLCGQVPSGVQCGQCSSDAQCASFGRGSVCVTDTAPGLNCSCGTAGQGFCIVPCDVTCPREGCCAFSECSGTKICAFTKCGAGRVCAEGQCVTGLGTCRFAEDSCTGGAGSCNGNPNCFCFSEGGFKTRCGILTGACGACTDDDDCAAHGAGAVCIDARPPTCCPPDAGSGLKRCMAPCPT